MVDLMNTGGDSFSRKTHFAPEDEAEMLCYYSLDQ